LRRRIIDPYAAISASSTISTPAEMPPSRRRLRVTTEADEGTGGGIGRSRGSAPDAAGIACGGDIVAALARASRASATR